MGEIKKVPLKDMEALVHLVNGAYPGIADFSEESVKHVSERFQTLQQEESTLNFFGYYLDGQLVGAMRHHDFQMNMLGKVIPAGGVGLVAVDLLHKKQKVAKELLTFYIEHYHKRNISMTLLYPFRPDFYKKMGFGFGPRMDSYKIKPEAFRNYKKKGHLRYLTADDKALVKKCYNAFYKQTHGMIEKPDFDYKSLLGRPGQFVIGYVIGDELLGYFPFTFKGAHDTNNMMNDLHIGEMIYLHSDVLKEFSTFLHSQADQINRIIVHTQDEHFYYLFDDPRNGTDVVMPHVYHETNTSGVGLMYRVNDVPLLFQQLQGHNFDNVTCNLKLTIKDSFYPENDRATWLSFENGLATVSQEGPHDVAITLDVSDFSSLVTGSINFERLYAYGLVELSDDAYVSTLNQLFFTPKKPFCRTGF